MSGVTAIIPAYNEERHIARAVSCLKSALRVDQVIVVDDGSGDLTSLRARQAGAEVISLVPNRGKAGALQVGVRASRNPYLLLMDADLETTSQELDRLLEEVLSGRYDMAVGLLKSPPGSGGLGLVRGLARLSLRLLGVQQEIQAPLSGQRALRRDLWPPDLSGYGFAAEIALTVHALGTRCRYTEVPLTAGHRITGRDLAGWIHRGKQFAHIAGYLAGQLARGSR